MLEPELNENIGVLGDLLNKIRRDAVSAASRSGYLPDGFGFPAISFELLLYNKGRLEPLFFEALNLKERPLRD